MTAAPQPASLNFNFPPSVPQIPDDVLARFPSLKQWQDAMNNWYNNLTDQLTDLLTSISNVTNQNYQNEADLQATVQEISPGAFAGGAPVATGTIDWVDSSGAPHKVLAE